LVRTREPENRQKTLAMDAARDLLERFLSEALANRLCASGWLGYGQPLFLGFDSRLLPVRDSNGQRSVPAAELQTDMAEWRIGDVSGEDEYLVAEQAVESLIGLPVTSWKLKDNGDLDIVFIQGKALEIRCEAEPDVDLAQWFLCVPGSRYLGIGPEWKIITGDYT
jgi:hypothetical protein